MVMIELTDRDLDALRRALAWGVGYQQRNPQIRVFPDPVPTEGTPEWLKLAEHLASNAQSHYLGLKPWQSAPLDVEVTGCAGSDDEATLVQTMRDLGISIYEPDPPTAIADATQQRASRRTDATRKVTRAKGKINTTRTRQRCP
jgi:hypothetical protein